MSQAPDSESSVSASRKPIPITVFTGFLGAGKTTVILSLLPKLPKDYKVVLLKNEFGDVAVDSQLAKQSSLAAVSEILNGCMCCVLVGQMKTALLEIREKFRPDRIIIECSGSAFPATLAFQIRELERETAGDLGLDAIITIVDAENFSGYEDTSPTAKMQSQFTDLLLINKWSHISERALDIVIDHLNTLNDLTPKVRCTAQGAVDPAVVFGLDSKLFLTRDAALEQAAADADAAHHDEVETITVFRGARPDAHAHVHDDSCGHPGLASQEEKGGKVDAHNSDSDPIDEAALANALDALSKETVWRVKGFVHLPHGLHILNWAFGRYELTQILQQPSETGSGEPSVLLTVMGERGEVKRAARKFAAALAAEVS